MAWALHCSICPIRLPESLEAFTPPANDGNSLIGRWRTTTPGISQRGLGLKELAEGIAKPNEMMQRQQDANGHFTEAGKFFKKSRGDSIRRRDKDWSARSRCDIAEMELRLGR